MAGVDETVVVDGRRLALSNLSKVLWPGEGFTKADVIRYYDRVADVLIPHLAGRPLVVTRYPDGIGEEGFYQKNRPPGTPDWVPVWPHLTRSGERVVGYVVCRDRATLLWLANQAALELHPWYSRCTDPAETDFAVIDLDPMAPATFDDARAVALVLREYLARRGVAGFLKTSGATGLHVYIPLAPGATHREAAEAVRRLGAAMVRMWPERVTMERLVRRRGARVYWDYLQNQLGKTLCAPYSLRPRAGAPVSCPIRWEELASVDPREWTIESVPSRVERTGDPWADILDHRQPLAALVGERVRA